MFENYVGISHHLKVKTFGPKCFRFVSLIYNRNALYYIIQYNVKLHNFTTVFNFMKTAKLFKRFQDEIFSLTELCSSNSCRRKPWTTVRSIRRESEE